MKAMGIVVSDKNIFENYIFETYFFTYIKLCNQLELFFQLCLGITQGSFLYTCSFITFGQSFDENKSLKKFQIQFNVNLWPLGHFCPQLHNLIILGKRPLDEVLQFANIKAPGIVVSD